MVLDVMTLSFDVPMSMLLKLIFVWDAALAFASLTKGAVSVGLDT